MEALEALPQRYENPELDQAHDECLSAIEQARLNGLVKVHVNMATGTGKTEVSARDVANYLEDWWPDANILYLCHDTRILDQAAETYARILPSYVTQGRIYGSETSKDEQLTFASFQKFNTQNGDGKLYQSMDRKHYKYIVIDEGHHSQAETYRPVIDFFEPDFMFTMTASPERTDQKPIEEVVGPEVYRLTLEEAIAKGHLASVDYRVFTEGISIPSEKELEDKKISLSEITSKIFVERQDEELVSMIEKELAGHPDPRTVVFCPSIDSAEHFSSLLPGKVAALHSQLDPKEQDKRLKAFKNGDLDMIVAVDQLNEGVDIPEANVLVFLRGTESLTVYLHQLGRGLRKTHGKESVLVLDFVANWGRIKFIKYLQDKLSKSFSKVQQTNPSQPSQPFSFNFSTNTVNAITAIEHAREKRIVERKSQGRKQQLEDREIEKLLGRPLPDQLFLSRVHEARLIKKIQEGYTKKRNHQAESEYITWRSRTIYSTVKDMPEENGLTLEDYFQIGCEALLVEARSVDKGELDGDRQRNAWLTARIKREIRRAHLAAGGKTEPKATVAVPPIATVDMYKKVDAPEEAERAEASRIVEKRLQALDKRQQLVLTLRRDLGERGEQHTLEEVGRILGVTRSRVNQIEEKALKTLEIEAMREDSSLGQYHRSDKDTFLIDSGLSRPVYAESLAEFVIAKSLGFRALPYWGHSPLGDPSALPTIGNPLRTSLGLRLAVAKRRRERMARETLEDIFPKPGPE